MTSAHSGVPRGHRQVLRDDSAGRCATDIAPATSGIQFDAGVHIGGPVRVVTKRSGVTETWIIDV